MKRLDKGVVGFKKKKYISEAKRNQDKKLS